MKTLTFLLIAFLFTCCNQRESFKFKEVACFDTQTPEFDGHIVSLLDNETGQPVKDTLIEKIPKTRNIFKPCRQYIYNGIYKDKSGNIISESKVWMMATGKRWEWQTEKQDEVAIQFEVSENDIPEIKKSFVNKKFVGLSHFSTYATTGIIENVQEVWMHPFRNNQFNFTEVAAFPAVKFPLEAGRTWTWDLSIGDGWGDWENTTVNSSYKIIGRAKVKTGFKEFEDCWKIESESTASFGDSQHNFWFDEEYGFIRMEYMNYEGQTLLFELIEVIEN